MNLNLGLESLNGSASGAVVPFTPASAIEMQNASEAITNLMTSLENYYDAARNAMLVKKAVKKYGKTQSIVALIGQEGLAAAQSFSMEGVWENIKNFLIKIWEKIKEWWGRFWGMFFSVESRLSTFVSDCKSSNKRLAHNVEFDAPDYKKVTEAAVKIDEGLKELKKAANGVADSNVLSKLQAIAGEFDIRQHGATVSSADTFAIMHYNINTAKECGNIAKELNDKVIKKFKDAKRDIDDYTKKFIDKINNMKIKAVDAGRAGDIYGAGVTPAEKRNASVSEQDLGVKIIKQAAKVNNQCVSACVKAATQVAIKLMSHTRLVD